MSLSKEDSTQLWEGVKQHKPSLFTPINQKFLNPQGTKLRHLPVRLYLPHAASSPEGNDPTPGSLRVVQALVTPALSSRGSYLIVYYTIYLWLIPVLRATSDSWDCVEHHSAQLVPQQKERSSCSARSARGCSTIEHKC